MSLLKKLDKQLLNLAWSLWTELGVRGTIRHHQNILIWVEELILFTSVLCEVDPRLRDEAIDWCAKYHKFVSISRMKSLMVDVEKLIDRPFSFFAATLNAVANVKWPTHDSTPWKVTLSHKSILLPFASAALLNIRARSIFQTGARADLLTFFLVHPKTNFSAAEVGEIGYSKRNLSEVLNDLHFAQLFTRFTQGNQQRFQLDKKSLLLKALEPIPEYPRPWRFVFKVLLTIRECIKNSENRSDNSKVVEIRNCLVDLDGFLQRMGLTPPAFQKDIPGYLDSFSQWILEWASLLAIGK
jgi:hypothetical protein